MVQIVEDMYPAEIVLPMKAELLDNGFEDLKTASEVESAIKNDGTTLVVINSVCGCSAGARVQSAGGRCCRGRGRCSERFSV